jgi:sugar phosphate isomerase/epimerase
MAKKWGYDGIEIEGKRPHGCPLDLDKKARDAIKKAAADNGLAISAISGYNDYASPVEEHRQNELLMTRELIKLAVDVGAPILRMFAFWSGVTLRDGCITYDIARHDILNRFPGTLPLEQWCYVRDCLVEAAEMAQDYGVTLALQNHEPIITTYKDMLQFIHEVNSPALKACLDQPLLKVHTEEYYRQALAETGSLMVHSHYGGRFERRADGSIGRQGGGEERDGWFVKHAKERAGFDGHNGYELCSPVLVDHRHAGQEYALEQAELACAYMKQVIAAS